MAPQSAAKTLLDDDRPPGAMPALDALWWVHRGAWERAHALVQHADSPEAAWVHAHLHRLEGDHANASYWYRRAGRPFPAGDVAQERLALVATLLART